MKRSKTEIRNQPRCYPIRRGRLIFRRAHLGAFRSRLQLPAMSPPRACILDRPQNTGLQAKSMKSLPSSCAKHFVEHFCLIRISSFADFSKFPLFAREARVFMTSRLSRGPLRGSAGGSSKMPKILLAKSHRRPTRVQQQTTADTTEKVRRRNDALGSAAK